MGVRALVLGQVGPTGDHQALGVEQPAAASRLRGVDTLGDHRRDHEIGNADSGFAGAEEQQPLEGERAAGDPQRRVQTRQRHCGGALDVVVEGADAITVALQQAKGVVVREVLELDDGAREDLAGGADELVDEFVVGVTGEPRLCQTEIQRVVAQCLVVGADVQHHRQALRRMYTGAGRVQRELADRDAHAAGAEVAKAEDALAVGHDDHGHVAIRPVAQDARHLSAIPGRDEDAARTLEDMAELLAGQADRRRVDDRHHLVRVLDHDAEGQGLVAIVQRGQEDVLLERAGQAVEVLQHPRDLFFLAAHMRRQQALEPEHVALGCAERGALVQRRVAQRRG